MVYIMKKKWLAVLLILAMVCMPQFALAEGEELPDEPGENPPPAVYTAQDLSSMFDLSGVMRTTGGEQLQDGNAFRNWAMYGLDVSFVAKEDALVNIQETDFFRFPLTFSIPVQITQTGEDFPFSIVDTTSQKKAGVMNIVPVGDATMLSGSPYYSQYDVVATFTSDIMADQNNIRGLLEMNFSFLSLRGTEETEVFSWTVGEDQFTNGTTPVRASGSPWRPWRPLPASVQDKGLLGIDRDAGLFRWRGLANTRNNVTYENLHNGKDDYVYTAEDGTPTPFKDDDVIVIKDQLKGTMPNTTFVPLYKLGAEKNVKRDTSYYQISKDIFTLADDPAFFGLKDANDGLAYVQMYLVDYEGLWNATYANATASDKKNADYLLTEQDNALAYIPGLTHERMSSQLSKDLIKLFQDPKAGKPDYITIPAQDQFVVEFTASKATGPKNTISITTSGAALNGKTLVFSFCTEVVNFKATHWQNEINTYVNGTRVGSGGAWGTVSNASGSGVITGDKNQVRIIKKDAANHVTLIENAQFTLTRHDGDVKTTQPSHTYNTLITSNKGIAESEVLGAYTKTAVFTLRESTAPGGYLPMPGDIQFSVSPTQGYHVTLLSAEASWYEIAASKDGFIEITIYDEAYNPEEARLTIHKQAYWGGGRPLPEKFVFAILHGEEEVARVDMPVDLTGDQNRVNWEVSTTLPLLADGESYRVVEIHSGKDAQGNEYSSEIPGYTLATYSGLSANNITLGSETAISFSEEGEKTVYFHNTYALGGGGLTDEIITPVDRIPLGGSAPDLEIPLGPPMTGTATGNVVLLLLALAALALLLAAKRAKAK